MCVRVLDMLSAPHAVASWRDLRAPLRSLLGLA